MFPIIGMAAGAVSGLIGKALGGGGGKSRQASNDPLGGMGGTIKALQKEAGQGVQAMSELAMPGFREAIGRALGDAYSVAGRSGKITTDLGRLNREAASMVSAQARLASSQAIGQAMEFGKLQLERDKFKAEQRGGTFSAIGGLLSKGLGVASQFVPGGSVAGKVIGGLLG